MKPKSIFQRFLRLIVPALAICLLLLQPIFSIASSGDDDPGSGRTVKKRKASSLNNVSVKIYPDALKRIMHVVAKENEGKEINFFVFDMEGTLVLNNKMKAGDHQKITGLARGTYEYRVFCGDEETANGKFIIK